VPVDADIARDVDVPLQAIRISDFIQPLAALPGHVKIVILDAARQNPFAQGGQPLASGLALVDPARDMAFAFNAAPGTVGPNEPGPYGAYATALTEMIAAGGLTLDDIFARARLRVSDLTRGVEVPWYASQIQGPFFMTERVAGAPPQPDVVPLAGIRNRPLRVSAISTMPMPRRWRSTQSPATSNFSAFIRTVPIRDGSPRCSPCAAKRSSGAAA
jgi:uncharacterized caspase-like protein